MALDENVEQSMEGRYSATMTENGRLVLPAHLRGLLGVDGQRAELFFRVQGDEITLTTKMQVLRRAQARLAEMGLAGKMFASEELIENRRTEARLESDDATGHPRGAVP